jgi:hypothetical protein
MSDSYVSGKNWTPLCERLIWPDLFRALVRARVYGCAVYDVEEETPALLQLAGIWCTPAPEDEAGYKSIDATARARALKPVVSRRDHIYQLVDSGVNQTGERWWECVLASGTVRRAGYVICCTMAAKDQDDVEARMVQLRSVFH